MHPVKAILPILPAVVLALSSGGHTARTADPDGALLRRAGVATDEAALLTCLRGRCGDDADMARVGALIRQLGSDDFKEREEATRKLAGMGPGALPALRRAAGDPDREVAQRARECAREVEGRWQPGADLAVVRLLVRRGGAGAVPPLLRFLTHAADEQVQEEICFGLDDLAVRRPGAVAACAAALRDPVPLRRAAAGYLLGRRGDAGQRAAARRLLADADALVRLRTAQGLLGAGDRAAIPVLVALLDEPEAEVSWQAEELLHYVAGEGAPDVSVGAGAAGTRRRCRQAWEAWGTGRGTKVDLASLDRGARPGLVLLVDHGNAGRRDGRVWLCGCDGKPRWALGGLASPSEARLVPGGRVVVAEAGAGVTERDLDGAVRWRYAGLSQPVTCQAVPGGRTFEAERGLRFAEIGGSGEEVFRRQFGPVGERNGLECPRWVGVGRVVCFARRNGTLRIADLDPSSGRVRKDVLVGGDVKLLAGCTVEGTPGGDYLVAGTVSGRVVEVGAEGRPVWEYGLEGSSHAVRLRGGNTLIGGSHGVVEVDGAGRMVWEALSQWDACRVSPCLGLVRLGLDAPRVPGFDLATSIPYRLRGLKSREPWVRARAVYHLKEMGPRAEEAIPALTALRNDPDRALRAAVREALAEIKAEACREVLRGLKDKDPAVRSAAIDRLRYFHRQAKVAAPALIEMLSDPSARVRSDAAIILGGMALEAKKVVPALIKAMQDEDADVRAMAAMSLGRFGVEARPAVPALLKALKGKDHRVAHFSAEALGQIGPVDKAIIPALTEALKEVRTRAGAAHALGQKGMGDRRAVPALLAALEAPIEGVPPHLPGVIRSDIVWAFGGIGPDAHAAVPALIKVLRNKDLGLSVRGEAARSLVKIGPAGRAAIPALEEICRDPADYQLARTAAKCLKRMTAEE